MQLCYVVPSQPQVDDVVNSAAVLSRWHLVVLHEDGSGKLWRARVSDLALRSGIQIRNEWPVRPCWCIRPLEVAKQQTTGVH